MNSFFEIHSEIIAKNYEIILINAIENLKLSNTNKDKIIADGIIDFCNKNIIPQYLKELNFSKRKIKTEIQKKIEKYFDI